MSWLYSRALVQDFASSRSSRALVAEFSAQSCSDGAPSARSSSNRSALNDWPSDKTKAFFRPFQSGTGELNFSTAVPGEDLLTWFREVSLARTFPQQILWPWELVASVRVSGVKCSESFARLDRPSSLWRIRRNSQEKVSEECSAIFPRWGSMLSGECWELLTSEVSMGATGSSSWATPTARDFRSGKTSDRFFYRNVKGRPLTEQLTAFWPTIRATDGEKGGPNSKGSKGDLMLPGAVATWPTVQAHDANGGSIKRTERKSSLGGCANLADEIFKWPTPTSSKGGSNNNSKSVAIEGHGTNLTGSVQNWPKPTVTGNNNRKGASENSGDGLATSIIKNWPTVIKSDAGTASKPRLKQDHDRDPNNLGNYRADLKDLVGTLFGPTSSSSDAQTESFGQLNPEFAEWLMGWPIGWTGSQPLATAKFQSWLPQCGESSPESQVNNP
jgi:hypothetical protein